MSRDQPRIITGQETPSGRIARKELCVEIGSLEHPYFSNSVRREIRESGLECFSPKLPALFVHQKFERQSSLRLSQTFNGDGTLMSEGGTGRILTSSEIRKSMMHGNKNNLKDVSIASSMNNAIPLKQIPTINEDSNDIDTTKNNASDNSSSSNNNNRPSTTSSSNSHNDNDLGKSIKKRRCEQM